MKILEDINENSSFFILVTELGSHCAEVEPTNEFRKELRKYRITTPEGTEYCYGKYNTQKKLTKYFRSKQGVLPTTSVLIRPKSIFI